MIRQANWWLGLMASAGIAACGGPPTPFAAGREPASAPSGARQADQSQSGRESSPRTAAEVPPPEVRPGRLTRIPLGTLFERQQAGTALIYDVRPPFFHGLGHIPGSVNWPKNSYHAQLAIREAEIREARDAGKVVVIYCTDLACPDARTIADRLAQRGHNITILEGGWDAWKVAGLPTA